MKLLYDDPRKRTLQLIEIALMVILLPLGAWWGIGTYRYYNNVVESEKLFQEAEVQSDAGNLQAAVAKLDQCLAVNPQYFPAYELLADLYADYLKKPEKALALLQEAARHTDDPRVHKKLGKHYLMVTSEFKKAQSEFTVAMRGLPNDSEVPALLKIASDKLSQTAQ